MNNSRVMRWAGAAAALAAIGLAVTACSDDDKKVAPTTTVEETVQQFMDRAQRDCPEFQPGFDAFYTDHPTPAAADYIEFLPTQIDGLGALATCIEQSSPPASVSTDVANVVTAMRTVVADFQKALDAAKTDDLVTTEKWLTQMHDVDVDKIGAAMQVLSDKAGS